VKARLQRERRETAALLERARRALDDSRKLLEQRELQLKQLAQLLKQSPAIAHGKQFPSEWIKS
jgi:hypothetical protein